MATMQKVNFEEAVAEIRELDTRYEREAYGFVRDSLDYTLKRRKTGTHTGELVDRHVGGAELLDGFREYSLREFGPMVPTVMEAWGVRTTEDVGNIVFNLIDSGIFGKAENDTIEDFREGYGFREAFVEPFLPANPVRGGGEAEEARVRSEERGS